MSHPKNKEYKSGGSPEKDERKMAVPKNELVPSSGYRAGDEILSIKRVASMQEVGEGEEAGFRSSNGPNVLERLETMYAEMKANYDELKGENAVLRADNVDLKKDNISIKNELNKLSASHCTVIYDRTLLHSGQAKRIIETDFCKVKFALGEPQPGEYWKVDAALRRVTDDAERAILEKDPIVKLFKKMNVDDKLEKVFDLRNSSAHPEGISFAKLDLMFKTLRGGKFEDEESDIIASAAGMIEDLKKIPQAEVYLKNYSFKKK